MNQLTTIALCAATLLTACGTQQETSSNPFFAEWDTPFGVPAFDQIQPQHYIPAINEGIARGKSEIEAIVSNPDAPTFENTILAYDNSGAFLTRTLSVFGCVTGTDLTPELEKIQLEVSPLITRYNSDISLNPELFARIKVVYEGSDELCTDSLQRRLTEKHYKSFIRSGSDLEAEEQTKLRQIDEQLSLLSLNFGRNLRKDNGAFALVIDNADNLRGLPQSIVDAAAEEAENRDQKGKWLFTLDKPSLIPFLQYAENRELREQLYKGYLQRCNHNDECDNNAIIDSIVNLRLQRANLISYPTHSAYILDWNTAKNPESVYALLRDMWPAALDRANGELDEMQAIKVAETGDTTFASWDWWFYAEKLRKAKYDLNEEELRPYFALDSVRQGIFALTNKLYGVTYRELTDIPKYNAENRVFEVFDTDSSHLGVLYLDFHPRASKRVGAWCTTFRDPSYDSTGVRIAPVVSIVCNFSKPTADAPALLNLDETATFFHEFGHGLHQLFSMVPYKGLQDVERDFVELPSQIMENWALEPEVLALYANHYETGEPLPAHLREKIAQSSLFNQGFATVEYLSASLLDLEYHTLTETQPIDARSFEVAAMNNIDLISQIEPRYKSPYFQHIFSGGYSSGYYSYIWAEVLDADAFAAYVSSGDLFNPELSAKFRTLMSRGGEADGYALYHDFRGAEPSKDPLLKRRGLK